MDYFRFCFDFRLFSWKQNPAPRHHTNHWALSSNRRPLNLCALPKVHLHIAVHFAGRCTFIRVSRTPSIACYIIVDNDCGPATTADERGKWFSALICRLRFFFSVAVCRASCSRCWKILMTFHEIERGSASVLLQSAPPPPPPFFRSSRSNNCWADVWQFFTVLHVCLASHSEI